MHGYISAVTGNVSKTHHQHTSEPALLQVQLWHNYMQW